MVAHTARVLRKIMERTKSNSDATNRKGGFKVQLLWLLCRSIAIMPYWVQYYVLMEFIYFVLRYLLRYRRRLIERQLSGSFPDKSQKEIETICNRYYRTLAEMFINTMVLAGMSLEEQRRRLVVDENRTIETADDDMRNVVVLTSHFGIWEYASLAQNYTTKYKYVVAYHKLRSQVWDDLYYRLRIHPDVIPVESNNYMRFYMTHNEGIDSKPLLLGLIADQSAPAYKGCRWYDFMNRKTIFYEGGEALALKYGLPVYYFELNRVRRGYYRGHFELIYDGKEEVQRGEITARYVARLEKAVCRQPEMWLWSHRRWKYTLDPITGEAKYNHSGY